MPTEPRFTVVLLCQNQEGSFQHFHAYSPLQKPPSGQIILIVHSLQWTEHLCPSNIHMLKP